jgi:hypothetical protein
MAVGLAVAVLLIGSDAAATGMVGTSVRVDDGVGDGLTAMLEVKSVTAGNVSGSSATSGLVPQPASRLNGNSTKKIAVRIHFWPLSEPSKPTADHPWNFFKLLKPHHPYLLSMRTASRNLRSARQMVPALPRSLPPGSLAQSYPVGKKTITDIST